MLNAVGPDRMDVHNAPSNGLLVIEQVADIATATSTAAGSYLHQNDASLRWRAKSIGASGWRRVVTQFADKHVPIQVKDPNVTPDPVVIHFTLPDPVVNASNAGAQPMRVIIIA